MLFGQEFVDLTADRDTSGTEIPYPVIGRDEARWTRPVRISGPSNVERFERAFQRSLPGYGRRGLSTNPTEIVGKILYLPRGRYLIENEIDQTYGWQANMWDTYDSGVLLNGDWRASRAQNPFGASVLFPKALTLWLAPGAVLVPVDGAIVHIASALVCDPVQVFDLSFGGLVVFGERVPKVLPEWWGVYPGEDHAVAIQHAVDAALHHRANAWEAPASITAPRRNPANYRLVTQRLPPIPVEFRGRYELRNPVEVRGGTMRTHLLDKLGPRGIAGVVTAGPPARPARETAIDAALVMEGVWQGRGARGAQLVAHPSFAILPAADRAVLRLVGTRGITIRNLSIDTMAVSGLTCLQFVPNDLVTQGMAVLRCSFDGVDGNLVEIGPLPNILVPARLPDSLPIAGWTNFGSDMTGLKLDECEFRHRGRGYALTVRSLNSVPFGIHRCAFLGDADAMIVAWEATFHADGCRFENTRRPSAPALAVPGFEPPDGVDIYLPREPRTPTTPTTPLDDATLFANTFAAFTADACISTSPVFLATPSMAGSNQYPTWPVVLFNVRHIPSALPPDHASIRWALFPGLARYVQFVSRQRSERMGPEPPLVIIGGQYAGELNAAYGAAPSVVVGARNLGGGLIPINRPPWPTTPANYFRVFGLPYDQEAW